MRPVAFAAAALLVPSLALADFADHWAAVGDVGLAKSPRRGTSRIVVIPLVVEDAGASLDLAALRSFFEGTGDEGFSAYFRDQSLGTFAVTAEVAAPVTYATCPLPAAQFPGCRVERGDLAALAPAMELLRDVLRRADAAGLDATRYDANGPAGAADGIADGVLVVTNLAFDGIALPIYHLNTGDDLAGGSGGPFVVDGIEVPIVALAPDRFVAVHEFGHVLGLTDLYDETHASHGLQYSLMGGWVAAEAIPGLDAPTRVALGWAHVRTVRGTESIALPPAETSGAVVALGVGPERFLVENRGPGRWDRAMRSRGLAVYHVDWDAGPDGSPGSFLQRLLSCVECDAWHPFLANLQADGLFELQDGIGEGDDVGDLFRDGDVLGPDPSGIPVGPTHRVLSSNRYDGTATGIEIRDIAVDEGTGDISFVAVAPEDGEACAGIACPAGEECVDGGCWLDDGSGGTGGAGGTGGSGGPGGSGGSGGTGGTGGSGGTGGTGATGVPGGTGGSAGDGGGCGTAGGGVRLAALAGVLGLASRRRRRAASPGTGGRPRVLGGGS